MFILIMNVYNLIVELIIMYIVLIYNHNFNIKLNIMIYNRENRIKRYIVRFGI